MSYAAFFKLKAVEATEKQATLKQQKTLEWMRAILEDGERIVHWIPSPIQNAQKEGPKLDNSLKWKRIFSSGLRFKGRMITLRICRVGLYASFYKIHHFRAVF